jgi:hypothetical protein
MYKGSFKLFPVEPRWWRFGILVIGVWSALLGMSGAGGSQAQAQVHVRNGGFVERGANPVTAEVVESYRQQGWQCPDAGKWPLWWSLFSNDGTVDFPYAGGMGNDSYAQISSGKSGEVYFCGYHGFPLEERNYVYTAWVRGAGRLNFHVISYGKAEDGRAIQLTAPGEAAADRTVKVESQQWVRYRHLLVKTPPLWNVHPWMGITGKLDIDDVDIVPSTPALDLIVQAEEELYGTGALIEQLDVVKADADFQERVRLYRDALTAYGQAKPALDDALAASLDTEIQRLAPYVLTEGLSVVRVPYYNEMIVLTQVLNTLTKKPVSPPAPVKATQATTTLEYRPGVRTLQPHTVMITSITPNKILYEEEEEATARVVIRNTTDAEQTVSVTAMQLVDVDQGREVAQQRLTIAAGAESAWTVRYTVGPEMYGQALEVRVTDEAGTMLDRWQEYYQVGKEWFRVQMHSGGRYNNMQHWFSAEPTSWGIQPYEADRIVGEQGGMPISPRGLQEYARHWKVAGKHTTFYQNVHFSGIMGYEEMRKHPEYVLYDPNGQFAVDPVYGGYPDPMVLGSPLEAGEKRVAKKSYLDRPYTVWMHAPANFAMEKAVEYGARCIKAHAQRTGYAGVFIDGTVTAMLGYDYQGQRNLPEDREAIARLNARIQERYYSVLKGDDPYFGTWYNHSYRWPPIARLTDSTLLLGSGTEGDVSDAWIRAVFSRKNVSCLMEMSIPFHTGGYEGLDRKPSEFLNVLCNNRDYIVQRYDGNAIIGYVYPPISTDLEKPGVSKWGWPTVNYYMALVTASQHHIVIADNWPSADPALQFQTRYSRFLWSPDIAVVDDAEQVISVTTPEEVWWKRFVYRRETDQGYDLIVHLVRIPPTTERWDINWVDEPVPLSGVTVGVQAGAGVVQEAHAMRPYHFEEAQQPVQAQLDARVKDGAVLVDVPPFRYHTMLVLRVKAR